MIYLVYPFSKVLDDFTRNVLGPNFKHGTGGVQREHLAKYLPKSQDELPSRKMSVSSKI